jgi:L-aspartate oxidase
LLEGLVFGARAAKAMIADRRSMTPVEAQHADSSPLDVSDDALLEVFITRLRRTMWTHAGLLREEPTMLDGLRSLDDCETGIERFAQQGKTSRRLSEGLALCRVARAIIVSALARTESRGAHFRNDFPRRNDAEFQKHSVLAGRHIRFEQWTQSNTTIAV